MLSRGPCSMSFAITIWLFSKSATLSRLRNPFKIKRLFTQQIDTKWWMRRSPLSLYKSKLEVTTTFPRWWFQILSWNHQLEPLTTFRTRTVGLTTSLSSCFYTIRLEWHLDNWGQIMSQLLISNMMCMFFHLNVLYAHYVECLDLCVYLYIYTVFISVYKYIIYIYTFLCV